MITFQLRWEQQRLLSPMQAVLGQLDRLGSPILETAVWEHRQGALAWVGEGSCPVVPADGAEIQDSMDATRRHERQEGMLIAIQANADGRPWRLKVGRTGTGTCPIFVAFSGAGCLLTWDFALAVGFVERPRPNLEAARRFIEQGPGYRRQQIIEDIMLLGPGETLVASEDGYEFFPCSEVRASRPGILAPSADVTGAFLKQVRERTSVALGRASRPAIEISAGFDSSCVGVALHREHSELRSYGLIHDDLAGEQQKRRRAEILNILGFDDRAVPSSICDPFHDLVRENGSRTVFDEIYRPGTEAGLDAFGDQGLPDLVVTGIGGDELTRSRLESPSDDELPAKIPISAMVAGMSRADTFLKRGVWPSNPLASPDIFRFASALPQELRNNKNLHRFTLARAGLSDHFLFPRYRENFRLVFERSLRRFDADSFFRSSVLHDHRIADVSEFLGLSRRGIDEGLSGAEAIKLYNAAKLEAVLRHYV